MIERGFEQNDLASLLQLLRSCYDGWHDSEYWTWKYQKNPHGSPIIRVAEDKERIVGCYILNPVKIRVGQVSIMGAQSVDAAVDKAYRGAGIFKKLAVSAIAQAAKEGVALIYAFPTEIAYKGQMRIGYSPVFNIPKMFKVFHMHSLLEERGAGRLLLKPLSMMKVFRRTGKVEMHNRSNHGLEVREIRDFDPRFETFWNEVSKENKSVLVERDLAYLKWRYTEHPEKEYTTYACEKDGHIAGYIVASVERNISMERGRSGGLSVGNIIDLLTLPNMADAAFSLISASCDHFLDEGVDIARCWMFGWSFYHTILHKFGFSEYYDLLRRVAFRPKYNEQLICYVNSEATIREATNLMPNHRKTCWFMMQGDADYM